MLRRWTPRTPATIGRPDDSDSARWVGDHPPEIRRIERRSPAIPVGPWDPRLDRVGEPTRSALVTATRTVMMAGEPSDGWGTPEPISADPGRRCACSRAEHPRGRSPVPRFDLASGATDADP